MKGIDQLERSAFNHVITTFNRGTIAFNRAAATDFRAAMTDREIPMTGFKAAEMPGIRGAKAVFRAAETSEIRDAMKGFSQETTNFNRAGVLPRKAEASNRGRKNPCRVSYLICK